MKTRVLDPEVALEVESPRGTLSGVKIFEAVQSVKALEQYTGKLAFLGDEVTWMKNPQLDCDDSNSQINPGIIEGPPRDQTCNDGVDNDCDGTIDLIDQECLRALRWTFQMAYSVYESPAIGADKTIYVADTYCLYAINSDGSQ